MQATTDFFRGIASRLRHRAAKGAIETLAGEVDRLEARLNETEDLVRRADLIVAVLDGRCDAPNGFDVGEAIDDWAEDAEGAVSRSAARAED